MLISLFPVISFATDTREKVTYSFMKSDYEDDGTPADAKGIKYTNGNGNIEFFSDSSAGTSNDWNQAWDGINYSARFQLHSWGRNSTHYNYAAYKINGIKKGDYKLIFDYVARKDAATNVQVYILDAATTAELVAGTKTMKEAINAAYASPVITSLNTNQATAESIRKTYFYTAEADGEHMLVFIRGKGGTYENRNVFVQKITLNPNLYAQFGNLEHTLDEVALVGRESPFTAKVYTTEELFVPEKEGDGLVATVDDTETAEIIDASYDDGVYSAKLKGKKTGTVNVTFTATVEGTPTVKTYPVSVEEAPESVSSVVSFHSGDWQGLSAAGITYANSGRTLEWLGTTSGNQTPYGWDPYVYYNLGTTGMYAAYKMFLPVKEGTYTIKLDYMESTHTGRIGHMYLIPGLSTNIDEAIKNAEPVFEDINFYNKTEQSIKTLRKDVELTYGGTYMLVWVAGRKDSNTNGASIRPVKVSVKPYVVPEYGSLVHNMSSEESDGNSIPVEAYMLQTDEEIFVPKLQGDGIIVQSLNSDVAELTDISVDEKGILKATLKTKTPGKASFKFTTVFEGEPYEHMHTMTVTKTPEIAPIEIEMTQDTMRFTDSTVPSEDWETDGFDLVLELAKMTTSTSRRTPRYIKYPSETKYFVTLGTGSGIWPGNSSAQFTIKRKNLVPGWYQFDFKGVRLNQSGDYSIYVNGEFAGDFIFHDAKATDTDKTLYDATENLNTLYLPYGDVEISFRARRKNINKSMSFVPYSILFTPLENQQGFGFDHVESDLSAMLPVNESENATATLFMKDGTVRRFGLGNDGKADPRNCILSIEAEDESIAEVTDISFGNFGDEKSVYYTLHGKKTGTTNIIFKAKINGEEVSDTIPIEIIAKPVLEKVELSFGNLSLPATRTTDTVLSLIRSTDFKKYEYDYDVIYRTSDDKVAKVDENGVVTGVKEGKAIIYADVTDWDGNKKTGECEITILPKPALDSIVSAADTMLLVGEETAITTEAVMDDGLLGDISAYTLSYECSDESIATVDEHGKVRTLSEGRVSIFISAIGETGKRCSQVVNINIYESYPKISIDFAKTVVGTTVRVLEETPGYTVNTDIALTSSTSYKVYTDSTDGGPMLAVTTGKNLWTTTKKFAGSSFAIDIDVPNAGDYGVEFFGGTFYQYGNYSIFVNDQYAGDYVFRDPVAVKYRGMGETKTLNSVYLNQGKNTVIFAARDLYPGKSAVALLRRLTFTPLGNELEFDRFEAGIPSELALGESVDVSAYAYMNDGSLRHFGPSYEAELVDDENKLVLTDGKGLVAVAARDKFPSDGENVFTLTPAAAGETTLTLTAHIAGKVYTREYPIEIVDSPLDSTGAKPEAEVLYAGDATRLVAIPKLKNGHVVNGASAQTTYESLTPEIATITGETGDILQTHKKGTARVKVITTFNGVTVDGIAEIEIEDAGLTEFCATAGGSERIRLTDKGSEDIVPTYITAYDNLGQELDTESAIITVIAKNPEVAYVDEANNFVPVSEGDAYFDVTVELDGRIRTLYDVYLPVVYGKARSSYYTAEKALAARENRTKYAWAKEIVDEYVEQADKYIDKIDAIYSMLTSEGMPRAISVGQFEDPYAYYCRYCGTNLMKEYGQFSWVHNPFSRPWKVQCPDCKRLFPTNDFGSFYELGLNEYGEFDRMRALEAHRKMLLEKDLIDTSVTEPGKEHSKAWKAYYGYGVSGGYLYNEMYEDLDEVETLNAGAGLREFESEATWGVDDSWGYVPANDDGEIVVFKNGDHERHTYIAEYVHFGIYRQFSTSSGAVLSEAIRNCGYAYFYTGDIKYGRVAAILLDRFADFYKDFDIRPYGMLFSNTDGGANSGKMLGNIWECEEIVKYIAAYDMVYDVYEKDPYVVDYLRNKSRDIKMRHSKETAAQIRTNIEDGLLRPALEALRTGQMDGNFGRPQRVNALAAVVLDSMPETADWLDFLMAPGWGVSGRLETKGGGVNQVLMDRIDSDGMGDEASYYNMDWFSGLRDVQEILVDYDRYDKADLRNNVKFVQMYYSVVSFISTYYTPQVGDSSQMLSTGIWLNRTTAKQGWEWFGDPVFAQLLYKLNGNSTSEMYYDITEENPERLADEVQEVIDTYGLFSPTSEAMTNFGFAMLRDYGDYTDATSVTAKEQSRDVWMYFGSNGGHGHLDTLNLGMTAFGLNYLPENGYPAETGKDPERVQWTHTTLAHNTVTVDENEQLINTETRGKMKHFDDVGQVKIMDVAADYVYNSAEQYRRSVIMVRVDDENSYTVDLFRVLGGDYHIYSLHATSNEITGTKGLSLIPQVDENGEYVGTYAGKNVEFGEDPGTNSTLQYPLGYTWLRNVDRDESPENMFEVDFKIKDFRKTIKNPNGLQLHMTVHNKGNVEAGAMANVAIADGLPPQKEGNKEIDKVKYVLVKNVGDDLDTVFTTIFEPYRTNRYLQSSEELISAIVDGKENSDDAHRALKITHKNGRVDYIFWSTNNSVTYKITDEIAGEEKDILFRGFVGVYTLNEKGENIYKYVNDGDIIGEAVDMTATVVEGVIKSFTRELAHKNEIVLATTKTLSDAELSSLPGKYVYIDNGARTRSGTFKICGATRSGNNVTLDVGKVTAIRKNVDSFDLSLGYEYMIEEGQSVRIPLSYSEDFSPEFEPVSDSLSVSADSSISVTVNATSELGEGITYSANTLPRGASLNSATGAVTWKPDGSQVGKNHFAVTATDESGRQATVHFYVTVYGSTTGGNKKEETETSSTENTTPSGGGGGGGGGGAAPTDKPDADDESLLLEEKVPSAGEANEVENKTDAPEVSGETNDIRFTDISNHVWAADAINSLADSGVIKGTSENTFSPANNITRADFALLLVRAFALESDNTENFADVSASDYFASELAIARNTGIVNGIGDNKFAPRNTITRQDMMVIVYRALQSRSLLLEEKGDRRMAVDEVLLQYPDIDTVAPYAKEAVTALITARLVNGKNGLVAPLEYTTRAEVAVLIKRILDYIKE